jgi:hypothetical protein
VLRGLCRRRYAMSRSPSMATEADTLFLSRDSHCGR